MESDLDCRGDRHSRSHGARQNRVQAADRHIDCLPARFSRESRSYVIFAPHPRPRHAPGPRGSADRGRADDRGRGAGTCGALLLQGRRPRRRTSRIGGRVARSLFGVPRARERRSLGGIALSAEPVPALLPVRLPGRARADDRPEPGAALARARRSRRPRRLDLRARGRRSPSPLPLIDVVSFVRP